MGWRTHARRSRGRSRCSTSSTGGSASSGGEGAVRRRSVAAAVLAVLLVACGTASSSGRKPPKVVATVRTGGEPIGLAAGYGSLWVANYGSGNVARLDPRRNRVSARIDVEGAPYGAAVGAG